LENLRQQPRWTSLAEDSVWVHHTEHLLAAIAGAGIDNILVEMSTDSIPIVSGGSCADFYKALVEAGSTAQEAPKRVFSLQKPVFLEAELSTPGNHAESVSGHLKRCILGTPSESFSISYVFHVPHIDQMRIGFAEYYPALNSFEDYISRARSYFLNCESEELSTLLSPVQHDFIVLEERSSNLIVNEVARHKVMDFIGDLMILGKPVTGRFVAVRSGHSHHHAFIRSLKQNGCLELKTLY
jgi:UDP-3-O-acyl-N-acetylglucosamine deacetylase